MKWVYAELSKSAKAAGGPEKLLNLIEDGGKSIGRIEGRISMIPWTIVAALGASAITVGVIKLVDYHNAKKNISQSVVDEAKAELIQGIKDYDATHSEEKEVFTLMENCN